jgi:hypothetical protein
MYHNTPELRTELKGVLSCDRDLWFSVLTSIIIFCAKNVLYDVDFYIHEIWKFEVFTAVLIHEIWKFEVFTAVLIHEIWKFEVFIAVLIKLKSPGMLGDVY